MRSNLDHDLKLEGLPRQRTWRTTSSTATPSATAPGSPSESTPTDVARARRVPRARGSTSAAGYGGRPPVPASTSTSAPATSRSLTTKPTGANHIVMVHSYDPRPAPAHDRRQRPRLSGRAPAPNAEPSDRRGRATREAAADALRKRQSRVHPESRDAAPGPRRRVRYWPPVDRGLRGHRYDSTTRKGPPATRYPRRRGPRAPCA